MRQAYVKDIENEAEPHYCDYKDQTHHEKQHTIAEQSLDWLGIELAAMLGKSLQGVGGL